MHLLDQLTTRSPAICGHRGHSVGAPENTLASLRSAHAAGASLCEIDVRRTADGALVLMHDETVDRTTSGRGLVGRLTSDAVAGLDAGSWFGAAFAAEPVPTLRDALGLARSLGLGLIVEVKDRSADASWLADLVGLLAAEDMLDRCIVSSFDHAQLHALKREASGVRTIGIAHVRAVDAVALVRAAALDAIVLEFHLHGADDARLLRAAGVLVAYSLPRPSLFARHDAYGGDDLARLADTLGSEAVSLLIGDDVSWMVALEARSDQPVPR